MRVFSDDIAIDLGTANTLVHVVGRGIIIDEPSVVAVRNTVGAREILAVGERAMGMVGRTPEATEIVRPMRDGVIADFVATQEMLRQFIRRAKSMLGFRRPRILICVPAGATPVERRAVYETAVSAGARKVYLIEEPVAAAIGAGLSIDDPVATMVVDIGGGTTDIAVLSLGDVMQARSLKCAGNAMDEAIVRFVRRKHHLLIGPGNAERIKIEAGTAARDERARAAEIRIRGRDLRLGKPKAVVLTPVDVAEALEGPITEIAEFIQRAVEELPLAVRADVIERGISLSGGGSMLDRLDQELGRRVGLHFAVPEHPMRCVITGTARVLETLNARAHLLISP
ncbi:MAG: rod shape-determining protein [Hyphomicrobiaceae bacterium]|nr:rod shape-determining protein [Hyphomicrobiaceae bacterium]